MYKSKTGVSPNMQRDKSLRRIENMMPKKTKVRAVKRKRKERPNSKKSRKKLDYSGETTATKEKFKAKRGESKSPCLGPIHDHSCLFSGFINLCSHYRSYFTLISYKFYVERLIIFKIKNKGKLEELFI